MNDENLKRKLSTLAWEMESLSEEQRRLSARLERMTSQVREFTAEQKAEAVTPAAVTRQAAMPPPLPSKAIGKPDTVAKPVSAPKPVPLQPVDPIEKQRSELVETALATLKKIWSWILVGEEHRSEGVAAEYAIATTWLARAGIIALVACAGYFLKWSIDRQIISESGRVAIAMISGVGMVVFGLKLLGKKYDLIAQGLLGGGLLVLYFSIFAAGPMYSIIPISMAFALMILVTLATGVLATKANSLLIAIIGIAGGYVTPVLLAPAVESLPVLYSYILLLGVAILGIARYKNWHLLNYLGFLFTYILFFRSLDSYELSQFPVAISFLSVFFVIQSLIVYIHNIAEKSRSTTLEIVHLVANAAIYSAVGYWLIKGAYGRPYPVIMTVALALFYLGHVLVFLKKRILDRNLLLALIALAGAFTALTLPLLYKKESLTIALSLLALAFLWLGRRSSSKFLENLAYLIYMIVFGRLLVLDMPENFGHRPSADIPAADYWKAMAGRLWTFGVSITSVVAAFFLQRRDIKSGEKVIIEAENDTPQVVGRTVACTIFYWFAILFAFLVVYLEVNAMFVYWQPMRLPILTLLWCGMAGYFLWRYLDTGRTSNAMFVAMCVFLVIGVLKLFVFDLTSWGFCGEFIYDVEYRFVHAGFRLIDFGALLGMLLVMWFLLKGGGAKEQKRVSYVFGYGGLLLFFLYMTFEVSSLLHWRLEGFQAGGISVLWALFAISFVSVGIWKSVTPLRYTGLILFAIVAGKIILIDFRNMQPIYKVMAFMGVGVALLLSSFAYTYSNKKFIKDAES